MEIPTREQLERRMNALVADHLDLIAETNSEGFDLGVVAFAIEVLYPDERTWLRREERGYSPPMEVTSYLSTYCSDHRWWIQRAVFQEAYDDYAYPTSSVASGDDDEQESEA
jgi:hypothetical protein